MKLEELRQRAAAVVGGRWMPCPNVPGVRVRVRGFHSDRYDIAWSREFMALSAAERKDPGKVIDAEAKALAETILLDVEGIDDVESTPENMFMLLADKTDFGEVFRGDVRRVARLIANMDAEDRTEAAKN
jgi:hypothetical protein